MCVWCLNTCMFFNGLHVLVLVHVHVHMHVALCVLSPSFPSLTMSWTCDGIVLQSVTNLFLTCSTICYMRRRRRRREGTLVVVSVFTLMSSQGMGLALD